MAQQLDPPELDQVLPPQPPQLLLLKALPVLVLLGPQRPVRALPQVLNLEGEKLLLVLLCWEEQLLWLRFLFKLTWRGVIMLFASGIG
jgi:hypothetical protein